MSMFRKRPDSEPTDLIAYARAHVTSPGAHALLDEVERGRARQEGAPDEMTPVASIGGMVTGGIGYTMPWAMWADSEHKLWLHPDYPVYGAPGGTVQMRVELRDGGYHVWPPEGEVYAPQSEPGYVSPRDTRYLPVAEVEAS